MYDRTAHQAGAHTRALDTRRWLIVADALLIGAGILIAIGFRRMVNVDPTQPFNFRESHRPLFAVFGLLLLLNLDKADAYARCRSMHRFDDMLVLVRSSFVAAAIAVFVALLTDGFFTGFTDYSRRYVGLGFGVPIVLLGIARLAAYELQAQAFHRGRFVARVLILGTGKRAAQFREGLIRNPHLGLQAVGSKLGDATPAEIRAEIDRIQPDEVVLAFDAPSPGVQESVVRECAPRGLEVRVLPGVFEAWHSQFFRYGGVPVTTLVATPAQRLGKKLKSITDRMGAAAGILFLSPLLLALAVAIRIDSPGPIIFRHTRFGMHGRQFDVWKFRSMRTDADERLRRLLDADSGAREEWERDHKLRDDPRVTKLGRLIRKWSLDEFPQLVNVLLGQMSLVGPRPIVEAELEKYGAQFVFSQAKPGMTGLWQVSGRNQTTYEERIALDAYYVENWSFKLDVLILLKTVMVVLRREGAY